MTRRGGLFLMSVCCLLLLFSTVAWGQTETGQISGTITDPTGAVVVDAKVVAKSVTTGMVREGTSNSVGLYSLASLRPDVYEVSVEASGFRTVKRQVTVTVGAVIEISVQLEVGKTSQVVEVVAATDANIVNTENQTLSQTITQQQLEELPTDPTRNPYALVKISGNVAEDTQSMRGAGFAINGMRSASTDILLDGAENVDTFTATVGQQVPLDSVAEFSVLTNNFGAEYGRASGGVVNLVTKSGTNGFHGSAYEYNRVSHLSANTEQNDALGITKPVFARNDFGFSVGGPIKKDKLFFFNNTEWIRVRSSASITATIIDPSSYSSLAPASQAFFQQYGKLATGVKTLSTAPCDATLTGSPTCDLVSYSVPGDAGGGLPENTWMQVARVDWNVSSTTNLYVRYAAYHEIDFPGVIDSSPYNGYNTPQRNFDQNWDVSLSHFFTPSLGNTVKLTYNRLNGPVQPLSTAPIGPTLYTAGSIPEVAGAQLQFPGYNQTTPGNAIPFGGPQNLYQIHDDMSWTIGRHQFKFGGQYVQLRDNRVFGAYEEAVELLGTNLDSGLQGLMNGTIYQFEGAIYPQGKYPCERDPVTGAYIQTPACTLNLPVGPPSFERNYHYNDGAWYVQDQVKIMPRFTLNLGLRWEYYGPQHNANESVDSNFVMGPGATIFDQIRNGGVELAKDGGVFWKPRYGNFGPRVGFAWDIFGNGKTSFRAGYGISYERNFGNVTYNTIQNPPAYGVVSLISNQDVPYTMPVYTDNAGPLAGTTGSKALPAVSQRAINQNMATAYAEVYNASIDRQVGRGVFSVSYAGSHGVHLYDIANINLAGYGGEFLGDARASNRLNLQYSSMNYRSDNGYSHYDSLNLKYGVTNLGNKGLGLTANYTYSHSLDNLSSTFSDGYESDYGLGYLDAFNPRLSYGNSDFDVRQRLILAATWEVPWGKSASNRFVREALGGWGMGSILNIRSGLPFTIFDCSNFNGQDCPAWAPGQNVARSGSSSVVGPNLFNYMALPTYVDTTCSGSTPPVCSGPSIVGTARDGSIDSLGVPNCTGLHHVGCSYTPNGAAYPDRNQFASPGYWNLDANFYKNFKLTERFGLQFRGEFYNLFNHHNQYIEILNLDVSSMSAASPFVQTEKGGIFGQPGQPSDERRNIQFGLKLTF
jgi:hypothetical protein